MGANEIIKKIRTEYHLTQKELAKILKISESSMGMIEQGRRGLNDELKMRFCQYFNISMDYLMGLTSIKNPVYELENKLSNLNLSSQEYDNILNKWTIEQRAELPTEINTNEERANLIIFDIYMDYLKSNSIYETETDIDKTYIDDADIEFIKGHNEPIDNAFINLLKSLDKNKIVATSKTMNTTNNSAMVLVYGTIPAGIPMECIEDVIDTEEISSTMLKGDKQYFGLKVKGDSMFPDYLDGDILILLKQDDCESGDDCVIMVNGNDGTFKRVLKNEKGIILQPLNNKYQPMVYTNEDIEKLPIKILGKVVELRRKK